MFVSLLALTGVATGATTTASLDSGYVESGGGSGSCVSVHTVSATASDSFTLTTASIVDLRDIVVDVDGKHGSCEVTLADVEVTLDGAILFTDAPGLSGSSGTCCSWSVGTSYALSDETGLILAAGTHTLSVTVIGTA